MIDGRTLEEIWGQFDVLKGINPSVAIDFALRNRLDEPMFARPSTVAAVLEEPPREAPAPSASPASEPSTCGLLERRSKGTTK